QHRHRRGGVRAHHAPAGLHDEARCRQLRAAASSHPADVKGRDPGDAWEHAGLSSAGNAPAYRGPWGLVILPDTSAWIDYLRDQRTPAVEALQAAIEQDIAVLCEPVRAEIMRGSRDRGHQDRLERFFAPFEL